MGLGYYTFSARTIETPPYVGFANAIAKPIIIILLLILLLLLLVLLLTSDAGEPGSWDEGSVPNSVEILQRTGWT